MIMEYRKIIHLLGNAPTQPSKFNTRNWVEINDESPGKYKKGNQITFKTSMLRSSLCDYSDEYILVSGTTTITEAGTDNVAKQTNREKWRNILKFSTIYWLHMWNK